MEKVRTFSHVVAGASNSQEPAAVVTSIFVYPIKSCRGISVSQAPVASTGFRWDRQWLVVNSRGRAYTQRNEPTLALVEIEMPSYAFAEHWMPSSDSYMVVKAPGMDNLKISLCSKCSVVNEVSVWEWSGSAFDEGAMASEWFSTYLGKPSSLVRFRESSESRPVDKDYAQGYMVMFSDGFPFLLASQGSLDALNKLHKEPLLINRFRTNILVDGCEPYAEDRWMEIKINNLNFLGVKLCARCKVPTINQDTGVAEAEVTETLMMFRSDHILQPDRKPRGKVFFGQNMVCKESLSHDFNGKLLKIGDLVYVLQELSSSSEAPV